MTTLASGTRLGPYEVTGVLGISRVAAAGGTSVPITTLDQKSGDSFHGFPFFLPDGKHFLYSVGQPGGGGVYVGSLDSKERTRLLEFSTNAQFAQDYLLFLRDGTLMAQRFDPNRMAISGEATPVAEQVQLFGPGVQLGAHRVAIGRARLPAGRQSTLG